MSFFLIVTFSQNYGLLSTNVTSLPLESKQRKHRCTQPLEEHNGKLGVFVANADILKYFSKKQTILASVTMLFTMNKTSHSNFSSEYSLSKWQGIPENNLIPSS